MVGKKPFYTKESEWKYLIKWFGSHSQNQNQKCQVLVMSNKKATNGYAKKSSLWNVKIYDEINQLNYIKVFATLAYDGNDNMLQPLKAEVSIVSINGTIMDLEPIVMLPDLKNQVLSGEYVGIIKEYPMIVEYIFKLKTNYGNK